MARTEGKGRLDVRARVLIAAIAAGLGYWLLDSVFGLLFFRSIVRFMIYEKPDSLLESALTQVHPVSLFSRLLFLLACLIAGWVLGKSLRRRQAADHALRVSEERLQFALDGSGLGAWDWDLTTNRAYLSERFAQILRHPSPTSRQNDGDWTELVHPEDRVDMFAAVEGHLAGRTAALQAELRLRCADGGFKWVVVRGRTTERDEQGAPTRIAGTLEDVSQRRRADAERLRLASAVDQVTDGVLITDAEGYVEYVNPAFEHITGRKRADLVGRELDLAEHMTNYDEDGHDVEASIVSQRPWSGYLRVRRADDRAIDALVTLSPMIAANEVATGFCAVLRDVTRERSLERQMRQAQKMEALGRLAGGVAHDFNNMLQVINGYSELLSAGLLDPDQRELLSEVQRAGQRAVALTRQLLLFSRRDSGEPVIMDVAETLGHVERLLSRLLPESIAVRMYVGDDLHAIEADPSLVESAVVNLAINARDAMPDGGLLSLHAENTVLDGMYASGYLAAAPGPYLLLSVSDSGTGMLPSVLEHLFEPFFTTKGKGKGTGLGLSIVYGLMESVGGDISVYSEVGEGTTFKLFFPPAGVDSARRPADGRPTVEDPAHYARGQESILVVEDEAQVRLLVANMLRKLGYQVSAAENGRRALALLTQGAGFDLLLSDVMMPEMNGPELLVTARELCPHTKLALMSGHTGDIIDRAHAESVGIPLLSKPFTLGALAASVRQLLDGA